MKSGRIKLLTAASLFATAMIATTGYGVEKKLSLNFYGESIRGMETIKLKQEIKDAYPRINLSEAELIQVKLVATPENRRFGRSRAKATLEVGRQSVTERVTGRATILQNPSYRSSGKWQLQLRGPMTLNKVVVLVDLPRRGGGGHGGGHGPIGPLSFSEVDSFKVQKFVSLTEKVNIHEGNVHAIKLSASRNNAKIESVKVVFANGETKHLSGLEGKLKEGRQKIHKFYSRNGRNIEKVIIRATSSLRGSRARVHVEIGKARYGGGRVSIGGDRY